MLNHRWDEHCMNDLKEDEGIQFWLNIFILRKKEKKCSGLLRWLNVRLEMG